MEDKVSLKEILLENKVLVTITVIVILFALGSTIFGIIKANKEKNTRFPIPEYHEYVPKTYKRNEYRPMYVEEYTLINAYYSRYIRLSLENPEKAWDMLSHEGKDYFDYNYEKYAAHVKETKTVFTYKNNVFQYKVEDEGKRQVVTLIDSENYKYRFYVYGIWDYEVEFIKLV